MKDAHVKELLEGGPLAALSQDELATVRAHAASCGECRRAYEAARVSELLLKERAAETFEPTPFFQTRVMAALREQRAAASRGWSLGRLWRATGALVSSMALTVASLAVLTFLAPNPTAVLETQDVAAVSEPSEVEQLYLDSYESQAEMSDEQVLTTIYGTDEGATR